MRCFLFFDVFYFLFRQTTHFFFPFGRERSERDKGRMSVIKADVIREAAAAAGITSLRDDCAISLAADAEYRLREIVQDALNFKRHSRRRKLTTSDMCVCSSCSSFCCLRCACFILFCGFFSYFQAELCGRGVQKLCSAGTQCRATSRLFIPGSGGGVNQDSSRRIFRVRAGRQGNGF